MRGVRKRILVIEDERDIAELIRLHLDDLGFAVTISCDGNAGLRNASTGTWDLIILDLRLPGIDGLETYKRIIEIRPGQKAIIVSGFSESARVKAVQRLGAGQYVRKPYTIRKLAETIKSALNEKKSI